jgi:hypothetical protein
MPSEFRWETRLRGLTSYNLLLPVARPDRTC